MDAYKAEQELLRHERDEALATVRYLRSRRGSREYHEMTWLLLTVVLMAVTEGVIRGLATVLWLVVAGGIIRRW